jgi:ankyrin repeat protein
LDLIQPAELASERPYEPWCSRGRDLWDAIRAARAGDAPALRMLLERDPKLARYDEPLHFAAREGHVDAVRVLLAAGADPRATTAGGETLPVLARDRGHTEVAGLLDAFPATSRRRGESGDAAVDARMRDARALHDAARLGDRARVEQLLDRGADPNVHIDASGTATYIAKTRELRALLMSRGGVLDCYDLVWLGDDDEVVRRVTADPRAADVGCGGVFTAAATLGKRELVARLLRAGARVPPVVTGCRSYLLENPEILRLLLAGGMNPDLPNWQRATPLHDLCSRDGRGRPRPQRIDCAQILLDAGATISAKDEEYRSTPLAWAARTDLPDMVELLLARGAPATLPDDEPWATPLAWATRRRHTRIIEMLRARDAHRS